MAIKRRTKPLKEIAVKANDRVFLSITIGNAQLGGSIVKDQNGKLLAKGPVSNLLLGTGRKLKGKTYSIMTNVLDVNPSTNGIVVTDYFYKDDPSIITVHDKVDEDGDIYSLKRTYKFV